MTAEDRAEFDRWRHENQFALAFEYALLCRIGPQPDLSGLIDYCERQWRNLRQEAFAE